MKIFRWKAIVPLVFLLALIVTGWVFYLDTLVKHSVESAGAAVVGARVDLEKASVRILHGTVRLTGLQVTDPDSPMRNLFEAGELVAAVSPGPLFQKKIVIDSLLVRGVRFGTPRRESGALANPSSESKWVAKQVSEWASQIRIPQFSLKGLGSQVVNIPAISVDSLRAASQARAILSSTDSLRGSWEARVTSLDPRPRIDSAQQMVERLKTADVKALGVAGTRDLIAKTRTTVDGLTGAINQMKALERTVSDGVTGLKSNVAALDDARQADYAYARGLVNLPSLDAPDISPALFGSMALERLKPILYWVEMAERYMPPGLDPRARTGPKRVRASGLTVDYPRAQTYPGFLLRFADLEFSLEGENGAAGAYRAQVAGLTTEPTLYGRPMQVVAQRTGGKVGPRTVRMFGQLDHSKTPLRDSVLMSLGGLTLPTVALPPLNARVALGDGSTDITLSRTGDHLAGRWYVRTSQATWEKTAGPSAATRGATDQAQAVVEDLLWRTISGMRDIEIEARMSGTLARPSVSVRSNVGSAVAEGLKKAVGEEVAKAERLVRAKVDSLVAAGRREVDERVAALQTGVQARITEQRAQLERTKAELEARLKELAPKLPGGLQVPGGVRLPG